MEVSVGPRTLAPGATKPFVSTISLRSPWLNELVEEGISECLSTTAANPLTSLAISKYVAQTTTSGDTTEPAVVRCHHEEQCLPPVTDRPTRAGLIVAR